MRLTIEIIAALLLLVCVAGSSAAFAAGKIGHSADPAATGCWRICDIRRPGEGRGP